MLSGGRPRPGMQKIGDGNGFMHGVKIVEDQPVYGIA
jgi:hypothetical protein